MKITSISFSIAFLLFVHLGPAQELAKISWTSYNLANGTNDFGFTLAYRPKLSDPFSDLFTIFDSYSFGMRDAGRIISIDSSTDPDFSGFAQHLSNGTAEYLVLTQYGGIGHGTLIWSEPIVFNVNTNKGAVDFAGFDITRMDLQLSDITYKPNGIYVEYDYTAKLTVIGHPIPEANIGNFWVVSALVFLLRHRRLCSMGLPGFGGHSVVLNMKGPRSHERIKDRASLRCSIAPPSDQSRRSIQVRTKALTVAQVCSALPASGRIVYGPTAAGRINVSA